MAGMPSKRFVDSIWRVAGFGGRWPGELPGDKTLPGLASRAVPVWDRVWTWDGLDIGYPGRFSRVRCSVFPLMTTITTNLSMLAVAFQKKKEKKKKRSRAVFGRRPCVRGRKAVVMCWKVICG